MCEFKTKVLPAGALGAGTPAPATSVWGYRVGDTCPGQNTLVTDSYIGPVIVAQKGTPTQVTYINQLGDASTTNVRAYKDSVDPTIMWADPINALGVAPTAPLENPWASATPPELNACHAAAMAGLPLPAECVTNYLGPIPAAPHLHGGEIPPVLDGGPDAWWTGNGLYGHGYYSLGGFADSSAGKAVYTYPNGQDAAPIWFHDHVLGATRLNVYAGIAGAYMITDPNLALPAGLTALGLANGKAVAPATTPSEELLVPVVLQDRMFDTTGQLYFPAAGINPTVHPYWVPEFVGDTIAVNGKAWPFLSVEPKRYRFLFLNGSNARTYELYLVNSRTGAKGPAMWVIGNDQGYLDRPAKIDPKALTNNRLVIMPGERYEVIIDFAGTAGATFEMFNTARAPYPAGVPIDSRTTGRIMQFRVNATCASGFCGAADKSYNPATLAAIRPTPIVRFVNPATGTLAAGVTVQKTRRLTLNEFLGAGGPMEILVNNTKYIGDASPTGLGPRADFKPIVTRWNTTYYSELPNEGETEIWEIVNLTADAHPIHPHLVAFQILNRQAFDVVNYSTAYDLLFPGGAYLPGVGPPLDYNCGLGYAAAQGRGVSGCVLGGNPDPTPYFLPASPARPPVPSEAGWKDTAISYPGEVLRLVVRFAPTGLPNNTPADSAWYDFSPDGGHGYVWHCHIIDHEDNEMMRPVSVQANPTAAVTAGARTVVQGVNY